MSLMRIALAAAFVLTAGLAPAVAADYPEQKVVYHNNGPADADYYRQILGNVRNHLDAVGDENIELLVIGNGDGLLMLQQASADPELAERIDVLRERGVRFLICANTLRSRQIALDDLHGVTDADVVQSGVAEIARLQQEGFVYLHP